MGKVLPILARAADMESEVLPGSPLVEIHGSRRVLLENHRGILSYDRESICVKVKFGQISVCGSELQLACMTRSQLIITGNISAVHLFQGGV